MKTKQRYFFAALLIIVMSAASCASMKLTTVTDELNSAYFDNLTGSSLSIDPVEVDLQSSRSNFDLRGTKLIINGQTIELGDKYLERIEDMDLGNVGVVDTNIFKKAGVDTDKIGKYIEKSLTDLIINKKDIYIPINSDNSDYGLYSDHQVVYDFSTFPYTYSVVEGPKVLEPAFSNVSVDAPVSDFSLKASVTMYSEVFQILEDDQYIQNKFLSEDHVPGKGDYYLSLMLMVDYKLIDNNSGNIIFDQDTKLDNIGFYGLRENLYIPVESGNKDKYSRFFRDFDFNGYAENLADRFVEGILPGLRPLYRNINTWVKVEEEETE